MFKCCKCNNIDKFTLMLSRDYKGSGKYYEKYNSNNEIVITIDGYEFIPDLEFMNRHAACSYCGSIGAWSFS